MSRFLIHYLFLSWILWHTPAGFAQGKSVFATWFPQVKWKCLPQKFEDTHHNRTYWDGLCSSLENPTSQESWRLTLRYHSKSKIVGEKISGEVLFITTNQNNLTPPRREKRPTWYTSFANNFSTYLVGGLSWITLRNSAPFGKIHIYGVGLGVGLQSVKNLVVDFKHLPSHKSRKGFEPAQVASNNL